MSDYIVETHVLNYQTSDRRLVTVTVWSNGNVDVQVTSDMIDPDTFSQVVQFVAQHNGTSDD